MLHSNDPDIQKILDKIQTKGLKKQAVAERIGISREHFSYILHGVRPLTDPLKVELFIILGIDF